MEELTINGYKWKRLPNVVYPYDYVRVLRKIKRGEWTERDAFRALIVNDLFFFLYFVLGAEPANHPFIIQCCKEVKAGPRSNTLDIWSRDHWKSTIITVAETIQDILKNPLERVAIISYNRELASAFVQQIKRVLETNEFLKTLFDDVLYQNPSGESPKWSAEAIVVKRSKVLKEHSVEAHGLLEGMPTGKHFSIRKYDDCMTADLADSPDQIEKVKFRFDMSESCGMEGGTKRVIGTYYAHNDLLVYLQGQERTPGVPMYTARIKPVTTDGTDDISKRVLISEQRWYEVRQNRRTFATQYLLNPSPAEDITFHFSRIHKVTSEQVPLNLYKFMAVDPAKTSKRLDRQDPWGIAVVGVEPFLSHVGPSRIFLLDVASLYLPVDEALTEVANIYMRNGWVHQIGVEAVGMSTMETHVAAMLAKRGRIVSLENEKLIALSPRGQEKESRIRDHVLYPLNAGLMHMVDTIPKAAVESLETEMRTFGSANSHNDILDSIAYAISMARKFRFAERPDEGKPRAPTFWERMNRKQPTQVQNWMYY